LLDGQDSERIGDLPAGDYLHEPGHVQAFGSQDFVWIQILLGREQLAGHIDGDDFTGVGRQYAV